VSAGWGSPAGKWRRRLHRAGRPNRSIGVRESKRAGGGALGRTWLAGRQQGKLVFLGSRPGRGALLSTGVGHSKRRRWERATAGAGRSCRRSRERARSDRWTDLDDADWREMYDVCVCVCRVEPVLGGVSWWFNERTYRSAPSGSQPSLGAGGRSVVVKIALGESNGELKARSTRERW
jgi:hypothetical protein